MKCGYAKRKLLPRKPCIVPKCSRKANANTPLCSTHLRRKQLWGDPMTRMCRSCRKAVKLEEDIIGGPFLCEECLCNSTLCQEPGCGWKVHKGTPWCNRHFKPKGHYPNAGRPRKPR